MTANVYPKATQRIIPAGTSDPVITPVVVVLHVDAGNASTLFNWFNGPSKGIESHLFIRKDGVVEQYRQFDREADAQLGGNSWMVDGKRLGSISIETQGTALGYWTRAQKKAIKNFLLWAHDNLGIEMRVVTVPNPRSLARGGVGYHSLFNAWNSLGKSCPGPKRIAWFKNKLTPWLDEQNWQYVTVQDSDTVETIAAANGVTVGKLWRLNRPAIKVGERLRIR